MSIAARIFGKFSIYWLLRSSILCALVKPSYFRQRADRVKFYRNIFGKQRELLVFDIGAHYGELTDIFLRLGAKVISVEPTKENYKLLQCRFRYSKRTVIVNKAVSDKIGIEKFYITENSAYNTISDKWIGMLAEPDNNAWGLKMNFSMQYAVEATTLDALIAEFGTPYYIKIDVEAHELPVIRSLSLPVQLLSFEVHLPEFMEETIGCLRHLCSINVSSKFNYDSGSGFALDHFTGIDEFIDLLSKTQLRYMEIYCEAPSI